jgi:hypothetical protein
MVSLKLVTSNGLHPVKTLSARSTAICLGFFWLQCYRRLAEAISSFNGEQTQRFITDIARYMADWRLPFLFCFDCVGSELNK